MQEVKLGNSELFVGEIAFGCWRLSGTSVGEADVKIRTALNCGMTLIDTADIYGLGEPAGFGGAEELLGQVLTADPSLRSRMVLATKGGIAPPRPYDSSYAYLIGALDASLTRLCTSHVDLYQIHRPDLLAPMSETARALNEMLSSGKVRAIGVSNFTPSQTRALQAHLDYPLATTQPEFSILNQDPISDGTLDWCSETGATALAWSPLACGKLGSRLQGSEQLDRVEQAMARLIESHNATRSQIALAFTMHHGASVIPIIGTQTLARIEEAAAAAHINLSARDVYDLIEAYRGVPMP